jgi:uncharacterized membrane protein
MTDARPAGGPDTGRVEAFSDGVFAIVITLLVLDLAVPEHPAGDLLHELLVQWPAYLAFAVSFVYIGIIWLNHHALFRRIRRTSAGLNWANLGVLFGAVILPFPTAVLAAAFTESDDRTDQRVAVTFYALVAAFMSATWLVLFLYLSRRPDLLEPAPPGWVRTQLSRPLTGIALYGVSAGITWLTAPVIGLVCIVAMIVYHALTSEGLHEGPLGRLRRAR